MEITPELLTVLMEHPWPGNVRELENYIERLVVMAMGKRARVSDLPVYVTQGIPLLNNTSAEKDRLSCKETGLSSLKKIEKSKLEETLRECGWVQASAAKKLGITPRQIGYKIKKYGIRLET